MVGMAAAMGMANRGLIRKAHAAQPRRGGRLVWDIRGSATIFDPAYWENNEEYCIGELCYNRVVSLNTNMEVVPELAVKWVPSNRGKEWTFHLRKGVRFHHGRELEAKDVVRTLNHCLETKGPAYTQIQPAERFEEIDKYTVKAYLSAAFGEFPQTLTNPTTFILPHDISYEKLKTTVVGTGPFKFKQFVPGEFFLAERFADHWDAENVFLDEVKVVVIPDFATSMNALLSGEIDLMHECEAQQFFALKKRDGIVAHRVASMAFQPLVMDTTMKPFNDVRIRQAVKACLDREKFVEAVLQDLGVPANDHQVPSFHTNYADFPIKQQDYGLAKKLLSEAGYPNGIDLTVHTSEVRAGMVPSAITLKDQCAPAGINITIKMHPADGYWKQVWRKHSLFYSNWFGRTTLFSATNPYWHSKGKWNTSKVNVPSIDNCLEDAVSETDQKRAMKLYVSAQALFSELGGWVIPYLRDYTMAHSDKVHGYKVHPTRWRYFVGVWKEA